MTGTHTHDPNDSRTMSSSTEPSSHDPQRDAHRERLSAMMDGMLSADESRFLLRRMQHDAELAGCWERWQLFGDAMRGQTGTALPADFSRRVARAIADEARAHRDAEASEFHARSDTAQAAEGAVAWRQRLRWGGGAALAASVAIAALISTRQPTIDGVPAAAPAVAAHAPVAVPVPVPLETPSPVPSSSAPATDAAVSGTIALTADSVPRKMASIAAVSSSAAPALPQPSLASAAPRSRRETGATIRLSGERVGSATPAASIVDAGVATAAVDPFGRPMPDIIAKPWPRALLPDVANPSAAADYSVGAAGLHPLFQPRADAIDASARDAASPSSDAPAP